MTDVPIVRVGADGERELVHVRWGLVPRWAKDPSIGNRMINARGETLADKVSFRISYRKHRCLLPADGFYEWQAPSASDAQAAAAHRDEGRRAVRAGWPLRAVAVARRRSARHVHDRDDAGERAARAGARSDADDRRAARLRALARPGQCRDRRPDCAVSVGRDGRTTPSPRASTAPSTTMRNCSSASSRRPTTTKPSTPPPRVPEQEELF